MDVPLRRTQTSERQLFPPGTPKHSGPSGAWAEVFQACNKGFQSKMNVLGAEIVESVRGEISSALDVFRQEMIDMQRPVLSSLTDITERALILQESVDHINRMDWKRIFDLGPVLEEMHAAEVLQRDSDRKLTQANEQITMVAQLVEHMNKDSLGKYVQQLNEKQTDSDLKLSEIAQNIDELSEAAKHIAISVQEMQRQEVRHFEEVSGVVSGLEVQLTRSGSGAPSDVTPMLLAMKSSNEEVNLSFNHVLNEISSIQKALHIDFTAGGMGGGLGKPVRTAEGDIALIEIEAMEDGIDNLAAVDISTSRSPQEAVGAWLLNNSVDLDATAASNADAGGPQLPQGGPQVKFRKRMREFWAQTELIDMEERWVQTMPMTDKSKKPKSKMLKQKTTVADQKKAGLADSEEFRRKARLALMQPAYNVFDYYHDAGCAQAIAKSMLFENITLGVVALNSIWLAIDTDYNNASILIDADPVFQVMEHSFAVFFVFELMVRFLAFAEKRNCLHDGWFLFDSCLCVLMVLDTWILSIVYLILRETGQSLTFDISIVKMIRVFKLLRLSRLAKLLKQLPELIIIVKGIGFAARSVFVFFLLWLIIIYVFSVLITQIASGNDQLQVYFKSVLDSMNTLLLQGVFPNNATAINDIAGSNWLLWPIMVSFVLLVGITTLYMLVGVLVDVMGVISTNEKEGLTVASLSGALRESLEILGFNLELPIVQYELTQALTKPEVAKIIQDVGVDIVVLMDMLDLVYEEAEKKGGLTFENLMNAILDMRGSNPASVKDIKEHLRVMTRSIKEASAKMTADFTEQLNMLKADVQAIRDDVGDFHEDGQDSGDGQDGGRDATADQTEAEE
eukprot:TRINITY_DN2860_c0_g1_i1.p1 TRINITY_DN2860_c0_g1~~TRINITY_DN2860_c0_g1_i1.p1  ORF type:complete len:850 (-),score=163.91 TRINITY_DN2860_c0_g1_i1:418-2967(-)